MKFIFDLTGLFQIRAKAVELFRNHNYDKIQCSHGWLKKWSLRHGIALRYEGDSDLLAWCLEQFDRNRNIQHRELVNYAQEFLNGTHKSEFKVSLNPRKMPISGKQFSS